MIPSELLVIGGFVIFLGCFSGCIVGVTDNPISRWLVSDL